MTARTRGRYPTARRAALAIAVSCTVLTPGQAQTGATFIAVALDADTRRADERLRRHLETHAGVAFVSERAYEYRAVIDRLVAWNPDRGPFLARVTPYAFVAAELLGADVQVLATYVSRATGGTTYQAYLVVSRARFPYEPQLANVLRWIRTAPSPRTFAYHSEFSTSSYFLPALFLRRNDVFDMAEPTERAAAIRTVQAGSSSSDLVRAVARGEYDFAAVWSGTRAAVAGDGDAGVHFIELPTVLPNDLLVASASLDSATVGRIRTVTGSMTAREIDEGDFLTWRDLNAATDAREALANLRWLARERVAPATVDVRRTDGRGVTEEHVVAARQAIRLAGSELVNYDPDFHAQQDYLWTLAPLHDGAVQLQSRIVGSDIADQDFQISFRDPEDLTRRIGEFLRSRIHRIRYVWPYRSDPPTVLRDVDFGVPPGAAVKVRRIRWLDVHRNSYLHEAEFEATVAGSDFYKFELAPAFIATPGRDGAMFSPMGNISYRVILPREAHEQPIFRILTAGLLGLLVAGAVAAIVELRRLLRATGFRSVP